MRVRLLADLSDHRRKYAIGEVCDLPEYQAAGWIRQGLAIPVTTTETSGALEAAALDKPEESAMLPPARRRG